jgi:protein-S-isoprenylcysteine O-methyltransferase Ste14
MTDKDDKSDNAGVRFPPPFIYLGILLIGIGAERFVALRHFGLDRALLIFGGVALAFAGILLASLAVGLFRKADTSPEPWTGTSAIVTGGVYRFTRNPMYLGMALIYAGLAFIADSPVALILLPVVLIVIQTQVIAREERYLAARFGETYLDYKRRVRRWL